MSLTLTREQQKEIAIQFLKKLDIYQPYINKFEKQDKVCFFERYGGFYADQEPELQNKINKFEKETGDLVYAVTHDYTAFGEMYSFLIIPRDAEDMDEIDSMLSQYEHGPYCAFAYVWNKDDDMCSEYGDIVISSAGGGITRIN